MTAKLAEVRALESFSLRISHKTKPNSLMARSLL